MYPDYVMSAVRERFASHVPVSQRDEYILNVMTHDEVVREFLEYHGIIGYDGLLKNLFSDVYGVELS